MPRIPLLLVSIVLAAGLAAIPRHLTSRPTADPDFVHFESGQVHPATLTPGGARLLVVNTPDNRLAVFDLTGPAPARVAEIPVGLEPVAVAALGDSEAWVVNQLSDDVSIVNLNTRHVRATLRVGDEPGDVVFAGSPARAFVSVSQEDCIKVYDPANLAAAPTVIPIAGRRPRSLARNAAGTRVYVAVFHGGNRTSVLAAGEIPADSMPQDPQYPMDPGLPPAPRVGIVIQQQGGSWVDMYGNLWSSKAKYSVNDVDVAEIDAATRTVNRTFGGLGSVNYGVAVSPTDGRVAVTCTEARNLLRFEPRLRGYLVETRIGWITAAGATSRHSLNPHIDYEVTPGTQAERDSAIGIPAAVAYSDDGQRVYVASFASDRLAVLEPPGGAESPVRARVPTVAGPSGVVVDGARHRLYVVGRFHNQLQTLSTASLQQVALAAIGFDPTPDGIVNGRRFFYGGFTSAHGDQACASCHVFGDMDDLCWDLGDPAGVFQPPPPGMNDPLLAGFHPMKGPMVTRSLRGISGTGVLQWRGDRASLGAFDPDFVSLMGRAAVLADSEITALGDFVLPLACPPNPAQRLDRTMPDAPPGQPSALRGESFFLDTPVYGALRCVDCHALPAGTNGQVVHGAALLESQDMKVPELRGLYGKSGFRDTVGAVDKRGFGYAHDGSYDTIFDFLHLAVFDFGADPDAKRRDVEAYLLAFDAGTAPAVGYQITLDAANRTDPATIARMDTLQAQAAAGNCDLIAKGRLGGVTRGWLYQGGSTWQPDVKVDSPITSAALRALAGPGSEVTLTGVPRGSGVRMGLDRDRDSFWDGDEIEAGSDPGNPASTPVNVGAPAAEGSLGFALRAVWPNPFRTRTEVRFSLGRAGRVDLAVYDVMGREVRSVARGLLLEAGARSLEWDGRRGGGGAAPAGVYFVRLQTEGGQWTRPVIRVR